jgi:hypothetical protein
LTGKFASRSELRPYQVEINWSVSVFFATACLLVALADLAFATIISIGQRQWLHAAETVASACALLGIGLGLGTAALVSGENRTRLPYGASSLQTFLFAFMTMVFAALFLGCVREHPWGSPGLASHFAVPAIVLLFVAWPLSHVLGIARGVRAFKGADELPPLGALGICLNSAALVAWYWWMPHVFAGYRLTVSNFGFSPGGLF